MSKIRIVATEDDPIHEEKLRMVLERLNYEIVDVISDPHQVISVIQATNPDVLLMDIDLNSDISGIDLVRKINELYDIPTVFLTSHKDSATFNLAKEALPVAYLTKPYQADALERSIELAVFSNKKPKYNSFIENKRYNQNHIFIKDEHTLIKVLFSDISIVEAYDKYCYIHTKRKKIMIKERLKNIADQLPEHQFVQVHRSFILNLDAIDQLDTDISKLNVSGKEIRIGKTYKQVLLSRINTLG